MKQAVLESRKKEGIGDIKSYSTIIIYKSDITHDFYKETCTIATYRKIDLWTPWKEEWSIKLCTEAGREIMILNNIMLEKFSNIDLVEKIKSKFERITPSCPKEDIRFWIKKAIIIGKE